VQRNVCSFLIYSPVLSYGKEILNGMFLSGPECVVVAGTAVAMRFSTGLLWKSIGKLMNALLSMKSVAAIVQVKRARSTRVRALEQRLY
jgi:hypothetical protein